VNDGVVTTSIAARGIKKKRNIQVFDLLYLIIFGIVTSEISIQLKPLWCELKAISLDKDHITVATIRLWFTSCGTVRCVRHIRNYVRCAGSSEINFTLQQLEHIQTYMHPETFIKHVAKTKTLQYAYHAS
jgi:hypothetical protein